MPAVDQMHASDCGRLAAAQPPSGSWPEARRALGAGCTPELIARDSFVAGDADEVPEAGFPSRMPYYFRHTSRFRNQQHARALMRLRCCSRPFAASGTLHYNTPTHCPHCDGLGRDKTAEHALLDCPAYADLRAEPRFVPLFGNLPALARMRAFVRSADQHTLGAFVHACVERTEHGSHLNPVTQRWCFTVQSHEPGCLQERATAGRCDNPNSNPGHHQAPHISNHCP
jgi:hypothetical protein